MKKRNLLGLVLGLLLLLPLSVFGAPFDTVVIFGDSLSDNGNLYALDSSQVPSATYWQGRFSNGPVWGEYLTDADLLDCTLVDKAYAGAKTSGTPPPGVPGVVQQVAAYTAAATLPDNALFVIWVGANDFIGGGTDYAASVDNIETALEALATYGVENTLILNLPNLGATPRSLALGDPAAAGATQLTQLFNAELASAIDDFIVDNPDITVYEMDIYSLFADVVAGPSLYGLTNATDVSPNFAVADNFDNSAGYAFWDDIHPTTETHEEIALEVYELVMPEDTGDADDADDADDDDDDDEPFGCFINTSFLYK
jgi:thermolabile hemolysin